MLPTRPLLTLLFFTHLQVRAVYVAEQHVRNGNGNGKTATWQGPTARVTFKAHRKLPFGQVLKVVGGHRAMGDWDVAAAPGEPRKQTRAASRAALVCLQAGLPSAVHPALRRTGPRRPVVAVAFADARAMNL